MPINISKNIITVTGFVLFSMVLIGVFPPQVFAHGVLPYSHDMHVVVVGAGETGAVHVAEFDHVKKPMPGLTRSGDHCVAADSCLSTLGDDGCCQGMPIFMQSHRLQGGFQAASGICDYAWPAFRLPKLRREIRPPIHA